MCSERCEECVWVVVCLPACTLGVGKYYCWLLTFLAAARNNEFSTTLHALEYSTRYMFPRAHHCCTFVVVEIDMHTGR